MINSSPSPIVSICIPSYNYGHMIADAIHSVLNQTFRDFELVIVDNASVDNTQDIVQPFLRSDRRIRYIRNVATVPMAENWNLCLRHATGRYVNILCADDIIEPTFLEKFVFVLESNPGVSIVSCGRLLVDENVISLGSLSYADECVNIRGRSVINTCLRKGNLIVEPTSVLFRRTCAQRGFDINYRHLVDLEMWLHILEQGDFAFIPEMLCKIRQHGAQQTKTNVANLEFIDDEFKILDDYFGKEYISIGFLERKKIRFNKAMMIYFVEKTSHNKKAIHEKIQRHYNLPLFYFLYILLRIKQVCIDIPKRYFAK